jgi:hypothetical protein
VADDAPARVDGDQRNPRRDDRPQARDEPRLSVRLGVWVSDRTLLGKPDTDPAGDLSRTAGPIEEEAARRR